VGPFLKLFNGVTRICLLSEPSRRAVPGPRTIPTPALPKSVGGRHGVQFGSVGRLLAGTESEAQEAWGRLQNQFAALCLVVNQEKSRVTTVKEGFAFLGFEFRKPPGRLLYMWPRKKACHLSATGCARWSGRFRVARRLV